MKPCPKNRKLIAWLAMEALDARQTRDLRAHLENCEACRRYLREISAVTERLTVPVITADILASESFHQRVIRRLRMEGSSSNCVTAVAQLRRILLNRRVALPVLGAITALIAALTVFAWRVRVHSQPPSGAQAASASDLDYDLAPTIANYQVVANQSLEKLDELLTRQGNRNPSPARTYAASNALD
jgi:anti-sigma factor RsiW